MCAAAFYSRRQGSKDSGDTTNDPEHLPIQTVAALLSFGYEDRFCNYIFIRVMKYVECVTFGISPNKFCRRVP